MTKQLSERIAERVVSIPDYPEKGIIFRDIMPVSADGELFQEIIAALARFHEDDAVDAVVGIESRGFIFGGALARALGCGFVPVRKAGKLPRETICENYQLEYGEASIEMQKDALRPGSRIILMDDLLATGGTVNAAARLAHRLGATVLGSDFIIELAFLHPRRSLQSCGVVRSLLTYQ